MYVLGTRRFLIPSALRLPGTEVRFIVYFAMVCGVEPRSPPRWFRAACQARQLSLMVDSLSMQQVVWGYILPIADSEQIIRPDLTAKKKEKINSDKF